MKIIEMNTESSNSNKPTFHRTKFYNNRTKLELKSIDLIASQDLKLNNLLSNFDQLARDNKSKAADSISINDLTNEFLKTKKIRESTKNGPAYLVKKEQQLKRDFILKPKKSSQKPKEIISPKIQNSVETPAKEEEIKEEIEIIHEVDPNLIIENNDKMNYKNIEIDLKNNQIEVKNDKISDTTSDDKLSILSASESLKTESKNDGSKLAKSFLEKFFDNEPLSDLNVDNDETLKSESVTEKETKENDKENLDQDVSLFLEKIFDYKPNRSLRAKSYLGKIKKQTSIDDKLESLNNLKLNDPKSVKTLLNFTSAYEILTHPSVYYFINKRTSSNCTCIKNNLKCCLKNLFSTHDPSLVDKCCDQCVDFKKSDTSLEIFDDECFDNIIEASSLLDNNEFNRFMKNFKTINSKSDCCCYLANNNFKCCVENLYEKLVEDEYDGKIEELACCKMCLKIENFDRKEENLDESRQKPILINQKSVEEEIHETSEVDSDRISLMRKSLQESFELFFKQANKEPDHKIDEVIHLKIDGNDVLNETKSSIKVVHSPVPSLTPRKTIIKSPRPNATSNSNKKSVTFFEDPKYGFRVVEIPEWLEHLRDPVYSKSFNKPRDEWKN